MKIHTSTVRCFPPLIRWMSCHSSAVASAYTSPPTPSTENNMPRRGSHGAIGSISYLILVGSVAAYACYSYAIKKLPMTIVSLYAYINPIVAVILGWVILSEKLNFRISVGIGITIAGIYIVNRGYQLRTLWRTQLQRFKV